MNETTTLVMNATNPTEFSRVAVRFRHEGIPQEGGALIRVHRFPQPLKVVVRGKLKVSMFDAPLFLLTRKERESYMDRLKKGQKPRIAMHTSARTQAIRCDPLPNLLIPVEALVNLMK